MTLLSCFYEFVSILINSELIVVPLEFDMNLNFEMKIEPKSGFPHSNLIVDLP